MDETETATLSHQSDEKEPVYTVDEAIEEIGFGYFQVLIAVFCGMLWFVDAIEFMLLSILSTVVKCQWSLMDTEEALISSVVFIGFFFGGLFWGVVVNMVGRKTGLLIIGLVILTFGVLSAVQLTPDDRKIPGYPWLLACRFGVGFGAGGGGQSVTYYTEFLPLKLRGAGNVLLGVWWSFGAMLGAAVALGVLGKSELGWHWYLGLSVIPLALALFLFPLVPESARYYLVKGKDEKAQRVVERVAWYNCKEVPPGRVVSHEEKIRLERSERPKQSDALVRDSDIELTESHKEDGERKALLTPTPSRLARVITDISSICTQGVWKTTVILVCVWMGSAWLYYGLILLTTSLLKSVPHCHGGSVSNLTNTSQLPCEELQTSDYIEILWTSAAELPGLLFTILVIEIFGRKLTMAIELVISMIAFLLLFICGPEELLAFFLFIARASLSGLYQTVYIYTAEFYPTASRPIGFGVCTSAARIGGILTPFVAQVLFNVSDYAVLAIYAGSCLLLAVLVLLLPVETKGRALRDTGVEKEAK